VIDRAGGPPPGSRAPPPRGSLPAVGRGPQLANLPRPLGSGAWPSLLGKPALSRVYSIGPQKSRKRPATKLRHRRTPLLGRSRSRRTARLERILARARRHGPRQNLNEAPINAFLPQGRTARHTSPLENAYDAPEKNYAAPGKIHPGRAPDGKIDPCDRAAKRGDPAGHQSRLLSRPTKNNPGGG